MGSLGGFGGAWRIEGMGEVRLVCGGGAGDGGCALGVGVGV